MASNILRECQAFCASSGGALASDGRGAARLFDMIVPLESRYGAGPKVAKEAKTVTVALAADPELTSIAPSVPASLRT